MIVIGESIHVLSAKVKEAIANRDTAYIQSLAKEQVEKGAHIVDLNIGPQKKEGVEVMSWIVRAVQDAVDVPISLDTTNSAAIEAGLRLVRKQALINSTDATAERLAAMMPLAAEYGAGIVALTLGTTGLPTSADARISLAVDSIIPSAMENNVAMENIYFDPLVLTVNGNQDQAQQTVEAVRFFRQMSDPPPKTTCGLSNISNGAPKEMRPLINRVFLVMMMGAGLDTAILDPLDDEIMNVLRMVENRDTSSALGRLYVGLFDNYADGAPFDCSQADLGDSAQKDVCKTVDMLENKFIYAHSYLRL
ncbi:MAG: dihydropteroate synthase [Dehalococcoidia bacterium]|nr:dihydropteroate synthase [Dehalococcoidia bacterium]